MKAATHGVELHRVAVVVWQATSARLCSCGEPSLAEFLKTVLQCRDLVAEL